MKDPETVAMWSATVVVVILTGLFCVAGYYHDRRPEVTECLAGPCDMRVVIKKDEDNVVPSAETSAFIMVGKEVTHITGVKGYAVAWRIDRGHFVVRRVGEQIIREWWISTEIVHNELENPIIRKVQPPAKKPRIGLNRGLAVADE